jgi:hypothetical protein
MKEKEARMGDPRFSQASAFRFLSSAERERFVPVVGSLDHLARPPMAELRTKSFGRRFSGLFGLALTFRLVHHEPR